MVFFSTDASKKFDKTEWFSTSVIQLIKTEERTIPLISLSAVV